MVQLKKLKIKINNADKLETLLQEIYNEACQDIVTIQNEMNKLTNSVQLNDEIMDAKAKYAKAMNDFITSKDKAIGRKLDVAKLMSEILKYGGDLKKAFTESNEVGDWQDLINQANKIKETEEKSENNAEVYSIS